MALNLRGRHFLKLLDFKREEIRYLLDLSKDFKGAKRAGISHDHLKGKNIALIFEKTSTRTRCAFEVAAYDLGMKVTYLDPVSSQMGHKESVPDTAKVLGRMYDGIEFRGSLHETVEELAKNAGVPVWNGLTDDWHPTQMLADLLTMEEHFGSLNGLKVVFMGDTRNNVANSLMIACAKMGISYVACAPKELFPRDGFVEAAKEVCKESGGSVTLTESISEALSGAHVVYTDIWVSMGEDASVWERRIALLRDYQVNSAAMELARKDAVFLHCLPSFHDTKTKVGRDIFERFGISEMEVSDEVFSSSQSLVFDQAENRMHTIKAVLYATLF